MNKKLKLIKIGNSTGVILPKEQVARLKLVVGDELNYNETPEGLTLKRSEEDFDAQLAAARKVMKDYRSALRELAK